MIYHVRIKRPLVKRHVAVVPIEADYDSTAKTMAGHVLRGYAVERDDFALIAVLHGADGSVIGQASVIKDGAPYRGPNQTWKKRSQWGAKPRTAEETAEMRAKFPRVNKVVWK